MIDPGPFIGYAFTVAGIVTGWAAAHYLTGR